MSGQDQILAGLNEAQREAVLHCDGPLLVLAGAGSGKTRVLTSRIASLLAVGAAQPEGILAVTFTNKAAGEMKSRIEKLTAVDQRRMQVSTFHSFAALLLRIYGDRIGIPRNYTIYDEDDAISLIKSCLVDLGFDSKTLSPRVVRAKISDAKAALVGVEEYYRTASNFITERLARIYEHYQAKLAAATALDFDDLLFHACRLLREDEALLSKLQGRYQYLLIDEYQDTNHAQYVLALQLSASHKNIFAVGDEDQSIYGWRGAKIQNILNFEEDFPECRIIRLEQNYRSTQAILKAASSVVSHNRQRIGKTLYCVGDRGEPLILLITENDRDEAEQIAGRIEAQVAMGTPRREIAILYRTNAQSRALEESLRQRLIPYRIVGGIRFYQRKEIKDVLAYLKLIDNPKDDVSFARIINYPRRGIGEATVSALGTLARTRGCSMLELIRRNDGSIELSRGAEGKLRRFAEMIDHFTQQCSTMPLKAFILMVAEKSGIIQELMEDDPADLQGRKENVEELASSAGELLTESETVTLSEFLQQISLYTDVDTYDREADAVTLMTLHAAKGLEFDSVFITGLEEGLFPLSRTLEKAEELEEERRLFYVGMTRARKLLTISYALARFRFGERLSMRSRFVDEIPDDVIRAEGHIRRDRQGRLNVGTQRPQWLSADDEAYDFPIGSIVVHPRWGEGAVMCRRGAGEATELEVRFHYAGTKKLLAKFAKLRLVR